jgi:hypothetical protein
MTDLVDLRPLKLKALKLKDPVRTIILAQPDSMGKADYLLKAGDWLRLLEIKEEEKK